MGTTDIAWAHKVWNPTRGCRPKSPGCLHCYAQQQAARFAGPGGAYEGLVRKTSKGPRWSGVGRFVPDKLDEPLRWRAPRDGSRLRIFVNSMSDLFIDLFSFEEIAAIFGVMAAAHWHDFLILTKWPERARAFFEWLDSHLHGEQAEAFGQAQVRDDWLHGAAARYLGAVYDDDEGPVQPYPWPLRNVWLGVSVEDQATADERIPELLRCPAAVRWISLEPQIADVDLSRYLVRCHGQHDQAAAVGPGIVKVYCEDGCLPRIRWVVSGFESGPGARPGDLAWLRKTRDECKATSVPWFCKQLGMWCKGDHVDVCVQRWLLADGSVYVPPLIGPRARERSADAVAWGLADRGGKDPSEWPEDLQNCQEFPEEVRS